MLALPAPWAGPLFAFDGTTWGEDHGWGESEAGLPSRDPHADELGWAGFSVGSLLSCSCQDSQAGSVASVSQLLHPEGISLCLCLQALLADAGQPIVPFFSGSGRALFITGGLAPKRENMRKRNFHIPYAL